MVRKTALAVIFIIVLASITVSCGSPGANEALTFAELIGDADNYNGKTVTVEAFYFSGFEITALAGSLGRAEFYPERIVPEQPLIWAALERSIQAELDTQTDTPSGYPEYFGKVRVTGKFETGDTYGHLDAYNYRFMATGTEVLDPIVPDGG